MKKKHIAGYVGTAVLALAIGAAGSAGGSGQAPGQSTGQAVPTVTVTAEAPAEAAAPAVTTTVEVPGPTVTVPGPATTVTAAPPAPAVAMEGDGTYQIGVDVKPGTYVSSKPDSGNCYWARLSGGDGIDSIIDNANSAGQSLVTIKKGDKFFESNGCNAWTKR